MPGTALTHVLLSLAAVLLIPQALECCHGKGHTVIESLASKTGDAVKSHTVGQHHHGGVRIHANKAPQGRVAETVRALVTETVHARQTDTDAVSVSAPTGENAGQSPSTGAVVVMQPVADGTLGALPGRSSVTELTGRALRPAIPPPRA